MSKTKHSAVTYNESEGVPPKNYDGTMSDFDFDPMYDTCSICGKLKLRCSGADSSWSSAWKKVAKVYKIEIVNVWEMSEEDNYWILVYKRLNYDKEEKDCQWKYVGGAFGSTIERAFDQLLRMALIKSTEKYE